MKYIIYAIIVLVFSVFINTIYSQNIWDDTNRNPFYHINYDSVVVYSVDCKKNPTNENQERCNIVVNSHQTGKRDSLNFSDTLKSVKLSYQQDSMLIKILTDTTTYGEEIASHIVSEYEMVYFLGGKVSAYIKFFISQPYNAIGSSFHIPQRYYHTEIHYDEKNKSYYSFLNSGLSGDGIKSLKQFFNEIGL